MDAAFAATPRDLFLFYGTTIVLAGFVPTALPASSLPEPPASRCSGSFDPLEGIGAKFARLALAFTVTEA